MDGIDVAEYQDGIDFSQVHADFAIVKATQGTWYTNPCFVAQTSSAESNGLMLGCYHYAEGGDAASEADRFLDTIGSLAGHALLCLDWESQDNPAYHSGSDSAWCHAFADRVHERAGVDVVLYSSRGDLGLFDWSTDRLWVAQYASDDEQDGYDVSPWNRDVDEVGGVAIRQYSGNGRLEGYDGSDPLDLDLCYRDEAWWMSVAKGGSVSTVDTQAAIDRAEEICADNRYGYSLGGWGTEGEGYGIDCRGLVSAALVAGGYPTGGFTCTYDMRDCLTSAGWTWHDGTDGLTDCQMCVALHPKSSSGASDGHTALWVGDHFCEAWHDYSGGGSDGDLSGREVRTRDYYDFPWSGYLTWDGEDDDMSELTESHRADAFGDGDSGADPRTRIEYIDHYTGDLSRELLRTDDGGTGDGSTGDLYARICWMDRRIRELKEVTIPAMETAIKALAESKGADPDAVAKAVSDAVAAKLSTIDLKVTTK